MSAVSATGALPAHARYNILQQIATLLSRRRDEVASTITAEAGKPITDAKREVSRAVQTFTVAAEEARRIPGELVPLDWMPGSDSHLGILRRFPIGPVLGITPFNFPLNLVAHKVAPALAAGNPILIKPAPQTPLTALLLGEIALEAGLPPGGLNVVPCDNALAERLVMDPRFKLLSFTGSAAVGWMLKAKCGRKKVTLELGGNAGVVIEPDADLDLAAQRCAAGGFGYAGQTCISVQRVFAHHSIAELFTTKLLMHVARLKAGDPTDESTTIGPVIDSAAAHRIESWIGEAVAAGARVLLGGNRMGSVVEATVLSNVKPEMKVSCQEVFGPVITVTPYRTVYSLRKSILCAERDEGNMRKMSGFTLIELLVTVAVLAAIIRWSLPSFERLAEELRLIRATEPVYERLVYAHSEAIKRFRPILVSFSADGSQTWALGITDKAACTPTITNPSDANACTLDYDNNPATTDPVLLRTGSGDTPKVSMGVPAFAGPVTYTVFEPARGLAREGNTDRNGQVSITTTNFETRVQVEPSGNIHICSPAGNAKVGWYPDC